MPNLNRAPQRQLNALADKRVPHAELIPLMQQDREAYAQHTAHLKAKWAHCEAVQKNRSASAPAYRFSPEAIAALARIVKSFKDAFSRS